MKKHTGSMLAYLNEATQNAAETPQGNYKITYIDAEKIVPNEKNFYSIEGIEELANSLTVSDNIAPLDVVANDDGTYRLISGERRLSATLYRIQRGELESAELPCHILPAFKSKGALTADQVEMLAIVLANNYRQKTALDQLNEVQALESIARAIYEEEKENKNLSISDGRNIKFRAFFAERILNISDAALKRLQALNNLTQEAKEAFDNGVIGKTVAMALASLTDHAQNAFLEAIHRGEFSGSMADLETFKKQIEAPNKEDAIDPIQSEESTCDIEDTGSMLPESPPSSADTSIEEGEHEASEPLQDTEEEAVLAIEEIEDDKIEEPQAEDITTHERIQDETSVPVEVTWEEKEDTTRFDIIPENLSPDEAENDAIHWVIDNLERLKMDVQTRIEALQSAGRTVEAARWNIRIAAINLVIETTR